MLSKKIDRRKTYYKITNKIENHNRLQYHDGLIVDPVKFNDDPKASCVPGGIYFTTAECLIKFFDYGKNIRPLRIPKDAKVVLDPSGDKYRADRVIMFPKKDIAWYFDKVWKPEKFDWYYSEYLVKYALKYFKKWWDPEWFNWDYFYLLIKYASKYFDIWWDADKYNWTHSHYLAEYASDYFEKWWDPDKFNWIHSRYLAKYASQHFKKWWDPEKFDWRYSDYLEKYCGKYKHIWKKNLKKNREK